MILRFLALSAFACCVTSCSTPAPEAPAEPASPAPTPEIAAAANPLTGNWKFDFTKAVVHNAAYAANAGLTDAQQQQTKKFIDLSNGSTVTFTADTMTTRTADGRSASMKYVIKSADTNGNLVIANPEGSESTYSVFGDTLINTDPELRFVSVYKKVMPYYIP